MIIAANAAGIARAVAVLDAGGLVAAPTETVYGLAARAGDGLAVAKIYETKGRPSFNPLIVHVSGVEQAGELVAIDPVTARLMVAFWPGPLSLVLPLKPGSPVASLVTAGLPTLAVRMPAHPVMQALIAAAGPLAAPSANASGHISPTRASHVAASLGDRAPLILDGGACSGGIESTIVAVEGLAVTILRLGSVTRADLEAALDGTGATVTSARSGDAVAAPGMTASHYAPRQPVRLGARTAEPGEFHIGFGAIAGDASLSVSGSATEAAARLFDLLHTAEASGRSGIALAPLPTGGLFDAINDRLHRAATRD